MGPHDLLTIYTTKAVEYLVAVGYLLLFIPFWRYVQGPQVAMATSPVAVKERIARLADWFTMPAGLQFHPGHAWVRVDSTDEVTVGMDDFAGRLVGPVSALRLPRVGATLAQGEPAWTLATRSGDVDMLAPVDGTVVAVNDAVGRDPSLARQAPYDAGWLLRVKSPKLAANVKHLLSGSLARRWMDDVSEKLRAGMGMEVGLVLEDGGTLVDDLAHVVNPADPAAAARRMLLTQQGGSDA